LPTIFFEPLWNSRHIDHVEISAMESESVGSRGGFYDQSGALKDFVQNHLLNMLALIAMDKPASLEPADIRNQKVKVLRSLYLCDPNNIADLVVRGQYQGYAQDVGKKSSTETYVAIKVLLNHPRWQHTPFYLRTGKNLPNKVYGNFHSL